MPDVSVGLLAHGTLLAGWAERWTAHPDAPAVSTDGQRWLTYGELDRRSREVAVAMAADGLRRGDRVLMCAASSIELVVAHVAALRLGAVVVPANTAYTRREIAHVVTDAEPALAIVDDDERGVWIDDASAGACHVIDVAASSGRSMPESGDVELDVAGPQDPALIIYTSGTTGAPKGAVLTQQNLLAGTEAVRRAWQWTDADRLILSLPLFHLHGLGVGLHGTLLAGGSAVLRARFDAHDILTAIPEVDATLFFGVPTMYSRLAEVGASALRDLRLCVSGSAPLSPELAGAIAEQSGHHILERYGMSETLMLLSNPFDGERRPGTVGFPLPGVEMRLGDGDEIEVRGPNVFAGYWRRPDATAASFTADGWFRTGDVGAVDIDGYVSIVGRTKELIITGGYNVYPREVEEVLKSHPDVADAGVVGLPSAEWGELVVAAIVSRPGFNAERVAAFAAERLAAYKRPRELHVVDALPLNALGKLQRKVLVDQLLTGRPGSEG